jgi:hypothetical protein
VVYSLSYDDLVTTLKESQMDYIHFCFLRDKNKTTLDEFEVLTCDICKDGKKHTKFNCPKLHFIPFKNMVIHKDSHRNKTAKNPRVTDQSRRIQH